MTETFPDWYILLSKEENSEEFAQMTHEYYKLAVMKIVAFLTEKYQIPFHDMQTVFVAVFARMMNEAIYSLGENIKEGYPIEKVYSKQQLLNLCKVLNNEPIFQEDRDDIDTNISSSLRKFHLFVLEKGKDFTL